MIGAIALAASMLGAGSVVNAAPTAAATTYAFTPISNPNDPTFTQLLGINNANVIAGYDGSGQTVNGVLHPNKGFTLTLPGTFTPENYPGSMQTQVIGIDNVGRTDGFYIDSAGSTHGFTDVNAIPGSFRTLDVPGTTFNQLLGINDLAEYAGYYQYGAKNLFEPYVTLHDHSIMLLPIANAQATGINNGTSPTNEASRLVSGFYNDSAGNSHGFLWQLGMPLTPVNYPGAVSTQVLGLNNVGQAVGSYTAGGVTHGFVYTEISKTFQSIDFPSTGGAPVSTVVNGINDHGAIVGFYTPAGQNPMFSAIGFVGMPGVNKLATTTSLTSSSPSAEVGTSLTFSGTVTPSTATGNVVLMDTYTDTTGVTHPAVQLASVPLVSGGSFTYTIPAFSPGGLGQGKHSLTAVYQGDATYQGSTSPAYLQTITAHF
jgi:hypothetical protein